MNKLKSLKELLVDEEMLVEKFNNLPDNNKPDRINVAALIRAKRREISTYFTPTAQYGVPIMTDKGGNN